MPLCLVGMSGLMCSAIAQTCQRRPAKDWVDSDPHLYQLSFAQYESEFRNEVNRIDELFPDGLSTPILRGYLRHVNPVPAASVISDPLAPGAARAISFATLFFLRMPIG